MIQLQAVLCDMDGTLVDTEPYWEHAKLALAAEQGVPFTKADAEDTVGKSMMYSVQKLQEAGVQLSDQAILDYLVGHVVAEGQRGLPWLPGARDFLARAKAADIPVALVTQAWAPVAEMVVNASDGAIVTMVSGGDVQHPKPHPQPYLMAADKLGVDIHHCVAIEDSPSGVESAEAAGCPVVVVPGMHPVRVAPNRFPVASLAEIDRDFLQNILNPR